MSSMEALGYLRYGPSAPSVPRKGHWAVLSCDWDWFRLYAPEVERGLCGTWRMVIDRDRVFGGRFVDRGVHPALLRPVLLAPAWGPHISITRNERPHPRLQRLWDLGVQVGDSRKSQGLEGWLRLATQLGVPAKFAPGARIHFSVDLERVRTNGSHHWFHVESPELGEFRVTWGLNVRPRLPFHLTFAVRDGSD